MTRPIQTFQVGIKAFVWHDERLLLVQESTAPQLWELPGGRIDAGEEGLPAATVLARELREELGSDFRCTIGAPCACWVRPATPARPLPVFLVGLRCSAPGGVITLGDEHVAWRSVRRDEWAGLPLVAGYDDALAQFAQLVQRGSR